jgi:hypothetical protein
MSWNIFGTISKDISSDLNHTYNYLGNGINTVKSDVTKLIVKPIETDVSGGLTTIQKSSEKLDKTVNHYINIAGGEISDAGSVIKKDFHTTGNDVYIGLTDLSSGVKSAGSDIVSGAKTAGSDIISGAKSAGSDLSNGLHTVGSDIEAPFKDIFSYFSKYWYIILIVIVGVALLFIYTYGKSGGSVIG